MSVKAVFDVGSNSVKLLAARATGGGWEALVDEVRICALAAGLARGGRLEETAMERALAALEELDAIARGAGARERVAVGTEALRRAANGDEFAARLRRRTGLELRVLTGEEEARLSFLAAVSALDRPTGPLLALDVGGGSTEFSFGAAGRLQRRLSLPVGCIPLTEEHLRGDPPSRAELDALLQALDGALSPVEAGEGVLVGIGGTAASLGGVMLGMERFEAGRLRALELPVAEVDRQIELYRSRTLAQRREIAGLHPDRAPLILAGAAIIRKVMERRGSERLLLSDRALRHGLFQDLWID